MNLVMATLFMCLASGQCEQHHVRIDPKACKAGTYEAEVNVNGEWHPAKIGIRC